jgi:hypothetical protein
VKGFITGVWFFFLVGLLSIELWILFILGVCLLVFLILNFELLAPPIPIPCFSDFWMVDALLAEGGMCDFCDLLRIELLLACDVFFNYCLPMDLLMRLKVFKREMNLYWSSGSTFNSISSISSSEDLLVSLAGNP